MHGQTTDEPALVPLPKFFAVLGFTLFSFLLSVVFLDGAAWLTYCASRYWFSPLRRLQANSPRNLYACRGTGNMGCPLLAEPGLNAMSASPAYNRYPWAEDFWKEFRAYESLDSPEPYEPFRLWGMVKFQGKYINVDDTPMGRVRRTVNKLRPGCDKQTTLKVWFFGGSTAWGYGAPDFATIPSYLSEELNARGTGCVEVMNLAVGAYNTNQELIYLIQELKAGWRPDVAVFYDGFNDVEVGAWQPALASTHWDYTQIKAKFESTVISWPGLARRSHLALVAAGTRRHLLNRGVIAQRSQKDWGSLARMTIDNYESNIQLVRTLGKAYGFEVYAFWQPTLPYGNKPLEPFEEMLLGCYSPEGAETSGIRAVYEEAEHRSASTGNFAFLGRLFEGVSDPIFIDWAHIGPRGNEIVADAIARVMCSTSLFRTGKHNADSTH